MIKKIPNNLNYGETPSKLALNNTAYGILAIDLQGNLTFVNSKCLSILGYKAEIDLVGKNVSKLINCKQQDSLPDSAIEHPIYQSLYNSNEVHISDEYFMNADGIAIPVKSYSYSIINNNTITGGLTFFTDIVNDDKNEIKIIQDVKKYKLSPLRSNDIIWDWNIITDEINRAGEGINLFFEHETINTNNKFSHWIKLIHPEDQIRINDSYNLALNNIKCLCWEQDYRVINLKGQYTSVNDKALIIRDRKGKAIRLVGVMKDITELEKRIRLIIEDQNKKLEEIRWIQSHVVRAPLSRMMGIVDILKETKLNTLEFKGWVNHFINSSKELDSIIHDITNKAAGTKLKP